MPLALDARGRRLVRPTSARHCSAVSRQVYVHVLLLQHLYSIILTIYGLVRSNIRKSLDAEKAEKLIKIYQFYRAEEDNQ